MAANYDSQNVKAQISASNHCSSQTVTSSELPETARRLSSQPMSSNSHGRRYSDTDRPPPVVSAMASRPLALRSKDAARSTSFARDNVYHNESVFTDDEYSITGHSPSLEQHSCESVACAALGVLETTELLELICSFLESPDILHFRRIDRRWNATIMDSPHLRLHHFTYAHWRRPSEQFQLLPLKLSGLNITHGDKIHLGQWIELSFTLEGARLISPHPKPRKRALSIHEGLRGGLGSKAKLSRDATSTGNVDSTAVWNIRYEDLFVTQPPLLNMQAFITRPQSRASADAISARSQKARPPTLSAKLCCGTGITLGLLAETTQHLLSSASESGPSTSEEKEVVFKAIMSFCEPADSAKNRRSPRSTIVFN